MKTRRHEDVITEVPSLLREVRLHLERCWDHTQIPKAPNRLTLFSRERTTNAGSRSTKRWPSKVATETFTQGWGNLHNLIGGSQQIHKPAKELNRLGFQEPKSKKLLTFHPTESSPRTQTDAPNAIGKNTRSAQILLSQIPPKLQKLMGE